MPDYEPLWTWMRNREAARVAHDAGGEGPFSDDPVIAAWRFCNVRREDDRVTAWIRTHIRERYAGHPALWLMLCIARQINWPDTLAELIEAGAWPTGDGFDAARMSCVLNDRKLHGRKIYTGAYIISAPHEKGADKQAYIAEEVCGGLWRRRVEIERALRLNVSLQNVHALLTRTNGWGTFTAYQAVVDMRFTALLEDAPDVCTWAAAGPGTLRGLNRLHGRGVDAPLSQDQALSEMRAIFRIAEAETGIPLDFSDVPNILCETDKSLRVITGGGKPRARYVPGRGF